MCGILFTYNPHGVNLQEALRSLDLIHHRGPDDTGLAMGSLSELTPYAVEATSKEVVGFDLEYCPKEYFLQQSKNAASTIFMGHQRLSIIDLSPYGHQPMSYENGRYWIVYNGEIYNYQEIRAELEDKGYVFRTKTDTEVILASYVEYGEKCVEKFNGIWAFVIHDTQLGEIFTSRDRFGVKPLYFWTDKRGGIVFASEIKQFLAFTGWEGIVNESRAIDYLEYALTDHTEETLFAGVYQVRGGSRLRLNFTKEKQITIGSVLASIEQWYHLENSRKRSLCSNKTLRSEVLEKIKKTFKRAIFLQKISDVPVGTTLSGGIDSSAIATVVSKEYKDDGILNTFTAASKFSLFDERRWADIVNKEIDAQSHYVYTEIDDLKREIDTILWHQDEPFQSQSTTLSYFVYKQVKESHIKVILCGQGADEYMGGYGQWKAITFWGLIKRFQWKKVLGLISKSTGSEIYNYCLFIGRRILTNLSFGLFPVQNLKFISRGGWSRYDGKTKQLISKSSSSIFESINQFVFQLTLPRYLRWEDRNSMSNSIEARVPFLDHVLVECYLNIPDRFKLEQENPKLLFKEAMIDYLPKEIYHRKDKKGFVTPEEVWVTQVDTDYFRKKLSESLDKLGNRVNKQEILQRFEGQVTQNIPFDYMYWRFIQFADWMRIFEMKFSNTNG